MPIAAEPSGTSTQVVAELDDDIDQPWHDKNELGLACGEITAAIRGTCLHGRIHPQAHIRSVAGRMQLDAVTRRSLQPCRHHP